MIHSLQVLRFVAAAMVVHLHSVEQAVLATGSPGMLGQFGIVFGRAGVDLFFVISGFIIARTASNMSAGEFARKRLARIAPLYLLIAAIATITVIVQGDYPSSRDLLSTFLLWPVTDVVTPPLVGVAWTLCFEVLFYLAFGLILWGRWLLWPLIGGFVLLLLTRIGEPGLYFGNPIILEFLAGVVLARLRPFPPGVWLLPIGFALLVAGAMLNLPPHGGTLDFMLGTEAWSRVFILGLPATLIVYGALQITATAGPFSLLGDASYSLYLTHPFIVKPLAAIGPALPPDLLIVGMTALSVLFGWRAYELAEKPLVAIAVRLTKPAGLSLGLNRAQ